MNANTLLKVEWKVQMLNNITMNHSANNSAACWCCINYDCVYFFNSQRSTHLITHHFLYVIVSVHTRKILSDFLSFSMHCTTCFISVCVCVCVCVYVCVCVEYCLPALQRQQNYLSRQNGFLPHLFTKGQWRDNIWYLFHTEYEICIFDLLYWQSFCSILY